MKRSINVSARKCGDEREKKKKGRTAAVEDNQT
jgi:hypothetical protein